MPELDPESPPSPALPAPSPHEPTPPPLVQAELVKPGRETAPPPPASRWADVPDGARAWSVMIGSFATQAAVLGTVYSFGVFLPSLVAEFKSTRGVVSFVGTLQLGAWFAGGVFAGPLSDRYGARPVTAAGTVVWGLGMFLAPSSTELWALFLTMGFLVGIGGSLAYWSSVATLPQWFNRYRSTAVALASVGSGVGSIAFAFGGNSLVTSLGWRNALYLIGGVGVALHLVGLALVERRLPRVRRGGILSTGIELLKSSREYRIFLVGSALFQFVFFAPFSQLYYYVLDLGLSPSFGGFVIGMLGIGTVVGRVLTGPLGDAMGRFLVFNVSLFGAAITFLCWPAATTEAGILAFAFFYPCFSSGFIASFPTIASMLFGLPRLGGAFSLINAAMTPGALASGALAGLAHDATGSYDAYIFPAGSVFLLVAIMFLFIRPPKPMPADMPQAQAQGQAPAASASASGSKGPTPISSRATPPSTAEPEAVVKI